MSTTDEPTTPKAAPHDLILVQNVILPKSAREFMTPDWDLLFDFYPDFLKTVRALGTQPLRPQSYVLEICNQLEKHCPEAKRTADDWFGRILQHFGLAWLEGRIRDAMKAYNRIEPVLDLTLPEAVPTTCEVCGSPVLLHGKQGSTRYYRPMPPDEQLRTALGNAEAYKRDSQFLSHVAHSAIQSQTTALNTTLRFALQLEVAFKACQAALEYDELIQATAAGDAGTLSRTDENGNTFANGPDLGAAYEKWLALAKEVVSWKSDSAAPSAEPAAPASPMEASSAGEANAGPPAASSQPAQPEGTT